VSDEYFWRKKPIVNPHLNCVKTIALKLAKLLILIHQTQPNEKRLYWEDIINYMEDQEIINQVREALKPYDKDWDEWLNSDAFFLNSTEIKVVGYVLAFQDVEESARSLNISQEECLLILGHTIKKLENQQLQYTAWLGKKMAIPN
jgi:hypothetical protein